MTKETKAMGEKDDILEFEGEVVDAMPSATFKVVTKDQHEIIAVVAGRLRKNKIRILVGDTVKVETASCDASRGRIVWRKN